MSMRVGMVGLDTSHCPAFTRLLNDPSQEYHVAGAQVMGAYPGGSQLFSLSRDRVAGFTEELRRDFGVTIYDSIERLVGDVDAILMESVDGRQHLEQFRQMAVGKPVYIDKPLTTSVAEARELIHLAEATNTPVMSCSALRFATGIADLLKPEERVVSCEAFGPASLLSDYPGLFWYGVHSAEVLFAFMGQGCEWVRCVEHPDTDIVMGGWRDGRVGVMRGTRFPRGEFGCVVQTESGTKISLAQSTPPYYAALLQQIVRFFETGKAPIDLAETFEIVAFLESAGVSRTQGGALARTEPFA